MSYDNPRIKLNMMFVDIVVALAEGNPGAVSALMELAKAAPSVDPDSALGSLGPLCTLDTLDCYGSRIWGLFKDVCGQSPVITLAVLRANQLGMLSQSEINAAIDRTGNIDVAAILAQVQERLPAFGTSDTKITVQ